MCSSLCTTNLDQYFIEILTNAKKLYETGRCYQTYNDIPEWLQCPLCNEYNTRYKSYFLKHFKTCKEYEEHNDDILSYEFAENITIEDYIEQKINCINITRELIRTNDLEDFKDNTYKKIIDYIRYKLLENIKEYKNIDLDVLDIFQLFF